MAHAKAMETGGRKLRIITQVSEELAARTFVAREAFLQIALIDQVVDFAVERVADEAFPTPRKLLNSSALIGGRILDRVGPGRLPKTGRRGGVCGSGDPRR